MLYPITQQYNYNSSIPFMNQRIPKTYIHNTNHSFSVILSILALLILSQAGAADIDGIDNCIITASGSVVDFDSSLLLYQTCNLCEDGYYNYLSHAIEGMSETRMVYFCNPCDENCLTCFQLPTKCNSCQLGSYIDQFTTCKSCFDTFDFCAQCIAVGCTLCLDSTSPDVDGNCNMNCEDIYGANCLSCDEQNCLSCSDFYALDSSQPMTCVACQTIQNCQDCSNGPVCTICINGFYHKTSTDNQECGSCNGNCNICSAGPQCLQCDSGYFLDSTGPDNSCITCNSGYYLSDSDQCSQCPGTNCDTCGDMGSGIQCLTCVSPYSLNSDKSCQLNCQLSYGASCSTCDTSKCLSCINNYALNTANPPICRPCSLIPNCNKCIDGFICTQCLPSFVHYSQSPSRDCLSCEIINNCQACIDGPICSQCSEGYILQSSGSTTICVPCPSGYYFDGPNQCSSCPGSNCDMCGDFGNGLQCTLCFTPYSIDANNLCVVVCADQYNVNCDTCDASNCLTCLAGYALDSVGDCSPCNNIANCETCANGPICTLCVINYYYDLTTPTKECVDCSIITDCISCIDGPECTQCSQNNVLSGNNPWNTCDPCSIGNYVASPSSCLPCPTGCESCLLSSGLVECQSCNVPYSLNNDQCVNDCENFYGTGCLTCNAAECLSCQLGFAFPTGSSTCVDCTTINNCINCNDGIVCTECTSDRYLDFAAPDRSCVICSVHINNCLSCSDGPICLQCTTNYVLTAHGLANDCIPCMTGTYPTSLLSCSLCPTGCTSCSNVPNGVECQTCDSAYTLNGSNKCALDCLALFGTGCTTCQVSSCLSCVQGYNIQDGSTTCTPCSTFPNCLTCSAGMYCTQCSSPMVVDLSTANGTCVACTIANCDTCGNGPECIKCEINYVLTNNGHQKTCTTCPAGSYASSTIRCSPCPAECASCSYSVNGITCDSCSSIAIHKTTTQQCMRCDLLMNHCKECSSTTICNSCHYPYKKSTNQVCDQCQLGYFYTSGFCSKQSGCQIYLTNESRCLSCFIPANFLYNANDSTCKCKPGYQVSNKSSCIAECGDGFLAAPDESCDDGNLLNGDGCNQICQQENGFVCLPISPSQCFINYDPGTFEYNYAYRYEGENKGQFSLSLIPFHTDLRHVNWAKYVSFNISEQYIIRSSLVYVYNEETKELMIEFEFKDTVEELIVEFRLMVDDYGFELKRHNTRRLTEGNGQLSMLNYLPQYTSGNPTESTSFNPEKIRVMQTSQELKIVMKLGGINQKLTYEDETILQMYKGATIGSYIVTILILIQFIIGSYIHKMIGLQTIQILQFFFFIRIIVQKRLSILLNSMNVFKHAAYGGYSDYQTIYGKEAAQVQTLAYMVMDKSFVSVQLFQYFTFNSNLSLIVVVLAVLGFCVVMVRKNSKRRQYFRSYEQSVKDEYTIRKRLCQWIYDHFVFPYTNLFSMLVVFSTVILLQMNSNASQIQKFSKPSLLQLIQSSSFGTQLTVTFVTFSIYCFEVFQSYEEFNRSRLTQAQKARTPKSAYQKLEHDENDPSRPNYKPGYIFCYLLFYLMIELILVLDVLFDPLHNWGVQILFFSTFGYLIFIWKWSPYNEAVGFHNKALRLNHFTVFFFLAFTLLFKRVQLPVIAYAIFIYVTLVMLTLVSFLGYIRIVIEIKFRKKLLYDPTIMDDQKKRLQAISLQDDSINKKQALLSHNPYAFENQVKAWLKYKKNLKVESLTEQQINYVKDEFNKEIYKYQQLQAINDGITGMLYDNFQIQKNVHKQNKAKETMHKSMIKQTFEIQNAMKMGDKRAKQKDERNDDTDEKNRNLRSTIKGKIKEARINEYPKRSK